MSSTTTSRARLAPDGTARPRRLVVGALVACAVLIFAACSSSTSDSDATSSTSSTDATSSSDAGDTSTAADVQAADSDLGTILVDANGLTLYTLTNGGTAVECTGGCLAAWPPLLLAAGTDTATGGTGVTGLGTVATSDGEQVTHDGLPLYRFAGDSAAGDTTGEGISSFGGVWSVVEVNGDADGDSSSSPSPILEDDGGGRY